MKKRILTVLLAVCLVFALGTVSALAADEGFPDAGEGGVISLTEDITITGDQTLNLSTNSVETNGYSITVAGSLTVTGNGKVTNNVSPVKSDGKTDVKGIFIVDGGTLTIQQGNFETAGAEIIRVNSGTANVNGGTFKCTATDVSSFNERVMFLVTGANSKLNFSAGTIDADGFGGNSGHGLYGVYPANGATVVLGSSGGGNQPEIYTDFSAIALNNTTSNPATTVTINSGYYKSGLNGGSTLKENCVIYLPGECSFVINGGTFVTADTNANVISIPYPGFDVDLNINGGTFNASTGNAVIKTWGVKLAAADSSKPNIISIEDGEFASGKTFADFDSKEVHDDFITGGTFSNVNDTNFDSYLAPGLDINENGDVVIGNDAVAKVGDTVYTDLQAAFDAATKGQTVVLLKDINADLSTVTSNGAVYVIKTGITFDGNGKKITAINNKQDKVSVQVLGVENVTDAVKITDLVIDGSDEATAGIQAYRSSNVTIDNVDITDCDGAGVIVNAATVTAFDFDTSGNGWGGVNVDNRNYASATFTLKSGNVQSIYTEGTSTTYSSNIVVENGTVGSVFNHANGSGDNNITIKNGNIGSVSDLSTGKTADISVQGGTFTTAVASSYVDTDYVAYNRTTGYTYTDSLSTAMNAAGQNGYVDYVAGNGWDVTLYYDKDVQTEIEVPKDYTFRLPGGTFEGKQIEGWKYGSEVFEPGDTDKITSDRTYYVILRNGQYNIVIDDDIKHGDVSTDVSSADKGATVYIYVDPDIGYVLDDLDVCYGYRNQYSVNVKFVRTGVYSFIMPGNNVYITATFRYESLPFTDVNRSQWFYDEVYYVYTNGMMEGDSATTFNPDGRMTRAMFWAVLGRIDGATITGNDWAEEARAWAMREGVSDGTNPNDYVTREQMVTMLWRYAGEKNGSASLIRYTDADKISSYAVEAMRWAIGNGIIEGMTSTTLEPQGTATRAQCAAIFMRFDQM